MVDFHIYVHECVQRLSHEFNHALQHADTVTALHKYARGWWTTPLHIHVKNKHLRCNEPCMHMPHIRSVILYHVEHVRTACAVVQLWVHAHRLACACIHFDIVQHGVYGCIRLQIRCCAQAETTMYPWICCTSPGHIAHLRNLHASTALVTAIHCPKMTHQNPHAVSHEGWPESAHCFSRMQPHTHAY